MTRTIVISLDELQLMFRELKDELVNAVRENVGPQKGRQYVSREELAELTGVSLSTVDRLTRQGTIPSRKIRGRRMYKPAEVAAAFEADRKEVK